MIFPYPTCVVTGAASGVGRALAIELARRGSSVAICDLDAQGLEQTRTLIDEAGGTVFAAQVDVGDRRTVDTFAARVVEHLGEVDALFNNAGVTVQQTFAKTTQDDAEWLLQANLWGVINTTTSFLPHLQRRPRAAIVNISSALGLIGYPTQAVYSASKFAIRGISESLGQELAGDRNTRHVRVSCVFLGSVKTDIFRKSRFYTDEYGGDDRQRAVDGFDRLALLSPQQAALRILKGVVKRKARILVGADVRFFDLIQRLSPSHYATVVRLIVARMRTRR